MARIGTKTEEAKQQRDLAQAAKEAVERQKAVNQKNKARAR